MRPLAEGFQTPLVTRRDVADDAAVNERRFPLVAKLVRLVEGGRFAVRGWWRDWWLRLSILFLFAQVGFLLNMWWFVGERTASGEDALIRFFDSLVGIASVFLAGAVTIATCYSASRAARALDLTQDLQAAERTSERRGGSMPSWEPDLRLQPTGPGWLNFKTKVARSRTDCYLSLSRSGNWSLPPGDSCPTLRWLHPRLLNASGTTILIFSTWATSITTWC